MSNNFLTTVYGTLVSPNTTFDKIVENDDIGVFEAFCAILMVTVIGSLVDYSGSSVFILPFYTISVVITALIQWIFVAAVIDGVASIFAHKSKFDNLLATTGFAVLPWMLMGPVVLFKTFGLSGLGLIPFLIGIILALIIWIWSAILFLLAVAKTYNFSFGKAIVLSIMPFLAGLIAFSWLLGFINNLIVFAKP
ncbi:MAG: YIP1 family protein [Cyanobacteriota bacterium]